MKKVLVVDDAKNIRMLLTKCLELEGYQVKTATNGKDALALFSSERFDLAFLDIKLPELSGTEVLRRIRAQGNDTPVIVITAYPTVKNAVECTKLQSITYLQKPFTADRLRRAEGGHPARPAAGVLRCVQMRRRFVGCRTLGGGDLPAQGGSRRRSHRSCGLLWSGTGLSRSWRPGDRRKIP